MQWHLTGQTPRLLLPHGGQARVVSSLVLKDTFKLPLPRRPSSWPPSSRRRLHLSSTNPNPIQISADRKSITFHLATGETTTQRFAPTPKISSEKLQRALRPLLSTTTGVSPRTTTGTSTTATTTGGSVTAEAEADEAWLLDPEGDAIHRHFVFASERARENAVDRIMQVADEMKHHPHMARGGGKGEGDSASPDNGTDTDLPYYCLTVTCTTHQPTGLSGKDARLAARINELSIHSDVEISLPTTKTPQDHHQLLLSRRVQEEQARLIQVNRDAIAEALESCGCGVAKAAS